MRRAAASLAILRHLRVRGPQGGQVSNRLLRQEPLQRSSRVRLSAGDSEGLCGCGGDRGRGAGGGSPCAELRSGRIHPESAALPGDSGAKAGLPGSHAGLQGVAFALRLRRFAARNGGGPRSARRSTAVRARAATVGRASAGARPAGDRKLPDRGAPFGRAGDRPHRASAAALAGRVVLQRSRAAGFSRGPAAGSCAATRSEMFRCLSFDRRSMRWRNPPILPCS